MSVSRKGRETEWDLFRPVDVAGIAKVNADFGFRPATPDELKTGLALCERLIGRSLASYEAMLRLHRHTTNAAWVWGRPITGIHLMTPLTPAGEDAVRCGEFLPAEPSLDHCAAPGDLCAGVYVGAYAGQTREARKSIMQGAGIIRVACFAHVPCFARAATDDGARSMLSLGFAPVDQADPDGLWVQEALSPSTEAV